MPRHDQQKPCSCPTSQSLNSSSSPNRRADDEAALEAVRVAALGKSGSVSALLKTLGEHDARTSARFRARRSTASRTRQRGAERRREGFKGAALDARLASETIDVTCRCASARRTGRVHPISQVIDELTAIFADMGFAVAEGPDIETDDYNFTKLNFPEGHPAREMHDTFYFPPKPDGSRMLLRTHTRRCSAHHAQPKAADPCHHSGPHLSQRLRPDHTPMFHQVEGLAIDKGAHLGHLKWILEEFCKAFFEVDQVKMRFRPSFFPFTEPSLEVDIQCRRDKGEIRFGEGEHWLEILGCGMVYPNVLRIAASILTSTKASPGARASTASPCWNTACRTCAHSSRPMCAGCRITASVRSISRRLAGGLSPSLKFTLSWLSISTRRPRSMRS